MAGRPRKPDHLKIIDGEKNKDRINWDAPVPNLTSIEPPVPLSNGAMFWWNKYADDFKKHDILSDWDLPALAQLCDSLALYFEYRDLLEEEVYEIKNKDGEVIESKKYVARGSSGGVIKSPYWQMMRDAQAIAIQIMSRFGMTPSDRSRIVCTNKDDDIKVNTDSLLA